MRKKYSFDDHPEHKARLAEHHERWLRVSLDCTPIDDENRAACVDAVIEMYRLAGLGAPRVVFVPSPFVAAFSAGFAAAIWATRAATYAATDAATYAATRAATYDATAAATRAATDAATFAATFDTAFTATRAATDAATDAATFAATDAATDAATRAATRAATDAATDAATYAATRAATDNAARKMLACAASSWRMRDGGNMWASWSEYLAFGEEIALRTDIDYAPFRPYKTLALLAGPRYMHERFCIISEKPEFIKGYWRNSRFVAHCEDGPSHRWRDGSCLYFWNGINVGWRFGNRIGGSPEIIEHPESVTVESITAQSNAELRRVMIAKFGAARYAAEIGAKLRHEDEYGKLWEAPRAGDSPLVLLECVNGTPEPIDYTPSPGESGEWVGNRWYKHYWLRVPPTVKTTREAEAWIHGLDRASDYAPEART